MQIKKYLISALCLLVGLSVSAQSNTIVEVNYDRKVIHTDSLALPRSINVGALLRLLPELLARPGDNTLSNYEVQIDGVSLRYYRQCWKHFSLLCDACANVGSSFRRFAMLAPMLEALFVTLRYFRECWKSLSVAQRSFLQ